MALSGFTRVLTETIGNLGNEGNAGQITIDAAHLSISDLTRVGSDSQTSDGDAGSIHITVDGGTVSRSFISTSTDGVGDAGSVTIQGIGSPAKSIQIDGPGSGIFTDTQGTGAGGNIFVNANTVTLQNGGTLSAKTSGTDATATGGSITVNATDQVTMSGGASITASSSGPGNAGNILINAGQTFVATDSKQAVTTQAGPRAVGTLR